MLIFPVLVDLDTCNRSLGLGRYLGLSTIIIIMLVPLFTPSLTIFPINNWQMMKNLQYLGVEADATKTESPL